MYNFVCHLDTYGSTGNIWDIYSAGVYSLNIKTTETTALKNIKQGWNVAIQKINISLPVLLFYLFLTEIGLIIKSINNTVALVESKRRGSDEQLQQLLLTPFGVRQILYFRKPCRNLTTATIRWLCDSFNPAECVLCRRDVISEVVMRLERYRARTWLDGNTTKRIFCAPAVHFSVNANKVTGYGRKGSPAKERKTKNKWIVHVESTLNHL